MKTIKQTTATYITSKRIILASAYRQERHAAGRQERARKSLRKMGRFEDNEACDRRRVRIESVAESIED